MRVDKIYLYNHSRVELIAGQYLDLEYKHNIKMWLINKAQCINDERELFTLTVKSIELKIIFIQIYILIELDVFYFTLYCSLNLVLIKFPLYLINLVIELRISLFFVNTSVVSIKIFVQLQILNQTQLFK